MEELQQIKQKVDVQSLQVRDMVNSIVGTSTQQIDLFIDNVKHLFLDSSQIQDGDLDKVILSIPVQIYYLTQVLQDIDIKKGMSIENSKFVQNNCLINSTGTVVEKQAKSENESLKDRVVQLAYKNAASLIQSKINIAMEILASAKKVQQRRLEEMKLTKLASNSVGAF